MTVLLMLRYNRYMAKKSTPISQHDYRQLQQELDDIMSRLQLGELDIDEAVSDYSRGSEIVELMKQRLEVAQNTVTKIQNLSGE